MRCFLSACLCAALLSCHTVDAFLMPATVALPQRVMSLKNAAHPRSMRIPGLLGVQCQARNEVSRRDIVAATGLQLAGLALPTGQAFAEDVPKAPSDRPRNVIITGSNSGIGKDAAAKLAAGGYNVYLACRTKAKSEAAKQEIAGSIAALKGGAQSAVGDIIPMECDLASLKSVRQFAADWQALGKPLDVLVCNAGLSLSTAAKPPAPKTADGFEITVGTNHLGHFLLCNLLLPSLEKSPDPHPRMVITASQVHDPESAGGNVGMKATLGDLKGLETLTGWDMVDGGAFDGDKAYKDSKLCNVLFAREMQRRLTGAGSKVTCNSFSPGLITRSGLFRDQNPLFVGVFDFIVYNVARVAETVDFGGNCLVTMAVGPALEGVGGEFWSNSKPGQHTFEKVAVSKEAMDGAKSKRLWELSARAVGLTAAETVAQADKLRVHEIFT